MLEFGLLEEFDELELVLLFELPKPRLLSSSKLLPNPSPLVVLLPGVALLFPLRLF